MIFGEENLEVGSLADDRLSSRGQWKDRRGEKMVRSGYVRNCMGTRVPSKDMQLWAFVTAL